MALIDPANPGDDVRSFLSEYHLATLTIVKGDGTPHVTAVGFTYDPERRTARVITWADSWKAKHVARLGTVNAAICTVDGGRWLTMSGTATVTTESNAVAEGVLRYGERYRPPKERDDRVVIEVDVTKIVGRA